jgi:hypothetical protein
MRLQKLSNPIVRWLPLSFKQISGTQADLNLSIARSRISYRTLPVRYNSWAHDLYHAAFSAEAADVRILHYEAGPFCKQRGLESPASVAIWLQGHQDDATSHVQLIARLVGKARDAVMADLAGGSE